MVKMEKVRLLATAERKITGPPIEGPARMVRRATLPDRSTIVDMVGLFIIDW